MNSPNWITFCDASLICCTILDISCIPGFWYKSIPSSNLSKIRSLLFRLYEFSIKDLAQMLARKNGQIEWLGPPRSGALAAVLRQ